MFCDTVFILILVLGLVCGINIYMAHMSLMMKKKFPSEQKYEESKSEETEITNATLEDMHTFVALIDIVFEDGSKRTCTGTIVHDNVVLTAAHCFQVNGNPDILPELTASLVVIGTKKMFETGYEQYLPIERVIRHPKYKGWTADLAMVFTFSGMTSDKPGNVIPLDGEKFSTPVDSNVTVLSWGASTDDYEEIEETTTTRKKRSTTTKARYNKPTKTLPTINFDDQSAESILQQVMQYDSDEEIIMQGQGFTKYRSSKYRQKNKDDYNRNTKSRVTGNQSIYLSSRERKESRQRPLPSNNYKNGSRKTQKNNSIKSVYRGWRRVMGTQKNKLSVEVFNFVNIPACKKIVEKAMPKLYMIGDSSEVVCYASEDHYITAEDSGAPAVRQGHLVAVTVGGAECDGDHVAIGMRMSCFCSWVAENLPDIPRGMKCCENCCNVSNLPSSTSTTRRYKKRPY